MNRRSHLILPLGLILVILMAGYASAAGPRAVPDSLLQCTDHIQDGSFEAGYWRDWTPTGAPSMANDVSHHGTWSAVVGGGNNHNDTFYQDVALPAGATAATLSFWWQMVTEEGGIGTPIPYDFFSAVVQDDQGTQFVVESLSNTSNANAWYQTTFDLSPIEYTTLFGHTARIIFQGTTDGSNLTRFYVDQVVLSVCTAPAPTETATPAPECPFDEYESNNSFEAAKPLTLGAAHLGYICPPGDLDWFRLAIDPGELLNAHLAGMEGNLPGDYDLRLYDPNGALLDSAESRGAAPETILYEAPVGGDYRLLVIGYDGAWSEFSAYKLTVTLGAGGTATPTPTVACPIDEYENNDSFEAARPLSLGDDHTAYICPSGDSDWFWLPANAGQTLHATLSGMDGHLPADYDLHLYDPNGEHLVSAQVGETAPETLIYEFTVSGDYHLLVNGYQGAWSDEHVYKLRATLESPSTATPTDTPNVTATPSATPTSSPTPACPEDAFEPNWDVQNAAPITLPFLEDPLYLCPSDADYYSTYVAEGQRLWLDLSYDTADGRLALGLYLPNGGNIHYDDSAQGYKQLGYDISYGSDYVVAVMHVGSQANTVPYALSIQTRDSPTLTPTRTLTPTATRTSTATQTPASTPTRKSVKLTVWDMEATQGLQNLANDLPLVAGKGTYLRVYVTGDPNSFTAVGDVEATLDGAPLSPPSVPLGMVTLSGALSPEAARSDVKYTLNCFLPRSWVAQPGRLSLKAKVVPQGADDPWMGDNEATLNIDVEASPQLHIQAVQVRDGGFLGWGAEGPSYADYRNIHLLMAHLYPVAKVQLHPAKRSIPWLTGPLTLVALGHVDLLDRDPGPNTVIMGMVRPQAYAPLADGMGLPTRHVWVKLKERADQLAAHESGHGFGMNHILCYGTEHGPFETYPYPFDQISGGGPSDYWGTDLRSYPPTIRAGATHADIMTYCFGKHWISAHTYNKLRQVLRAGSGLSEAGVELYRTVRPLAGTEYLMALGTVAADGSTADLVSMLRVGGDDLDPEAKTSPDGDYALRLLGPSDEVLDQVGFGPPAGNHQEDAIPFSVLIPWDAATTRVVVVSEETELTSESVSAHAPEVAFDPVSDVVTGTLACSWTATDADGDDLVATLMFSPDDGATWEPVAMGIEGTRYDPDTMMWPETETARLRVLVSDGLNTSEAVSNGFAVPVRPPEAYIVAPEDGAMLQPGHPVLLRATGYDAEDGPLPAEAYAWSSDVDGPLGVGEEALVDALSQGWHTITLTATDSDGHVASDSMRVFVGRAAYLPLIMR